MYICICNALTDKNILAAVEQGARTVLDAYRPAATLGRYVVLDR